MATQEIREILIENLLLDPENPRLPSTYKNQNQEKIFEWMIRFENVIELMGSIGEKDYFKAEPILAIKDKNDNNFIVIEGNRRLAAVKLLNNPEKAQVKKLAISEIAAQAKFKPKSLPIIEFEKREDILFYLGFKHITGPQNWDSLAKAKYLRLIQKTLSESNIREQYKSLAKIIGSNASHVKNLLIGLQVYDYLENNDFFNIKNLNEEYIDFGTFYTAINRENISKFIGLDIDSDTPTETINLSNLRELTIWMFEKNEANITILGESRNIKYLDKIVGNENALTYLRKGKTLDEAKMLTDTPKEIFIKSINNSLNNIKIARDYSHFIEVPLQSMYDDLDELKKLCNSVLAIIRDKMTEVNED
jgi:hypothetical protein